MKYIHTENSGRAVKCVSLPDLSYDAMNYPKRCLLQHALIYDPDAIPNTEGLLITWLPSPCISAKWQR